MKILTREQFLKLDRQLLYSKFEPFDYDGLSIKKACTTFSNDFLQMTLEQPWPLEVHQDDGNPEGVVENAIHKGESIPINLNQCGRDGMFDTRLFLIWEDEDLDKLINELQKCKSNL